MVSVVESLQIDTSDVTKGSYIACMYDEEVWYGLVEEISEEFGDFFNKSSCILVLEVGLFFLKMMTLAGFMKVTFFALLSPQILPVEEEGTPFRRNQRPRLKRHIRCGLKL